MRDLLSDHVWDYGQTAFTPEQVAAHTDLFNHRAALFLTPTANIPVDHVGDGALAVRLPIPTPDYLEFREIPGYSSPRFWVDLLQRATGKIRWTPFRPARVIITRYDPVTLRDDHFAMGAKALVDALKSQSTGRGDAQFIHYFGAIWDDDGGSVRVRHRQVVIADRRHSCTRLVVRERYPTRPSSSPS